MLRMVISPAKNMDFKKNSPTRRYSEPEFLSRSCFLVEQIREMSPDGLQRLMNINPKLASLNYERFLQWHLPFNPGNALQAVIAFNGEVFNGLKAETLSADDLDFAQEHLRILSGLHGVLRPLDLIQPYRLEMETPLEVDKAKDL